LHCRQEEVEFYHFCTLAFDICVECFANRVNAFRQIVESGTMHHDVGRLICMLFGGPSLPQGT
jgi:hypothetical protein